MSADSSAFAASVIGVESFLAATDRMPDRVSLGHRDVAPGEYCLALSGAAAHLIEHGARFLGCRPAKVPRSRCFRHLLRCDE